MVWFTAPVLPLSALNPYFCCFAGSTWTKRQRRSPWTPRSCGESKSSIPSCPSDPCSTGKVGCPQSWEGMPSCPGPHQVCQEDRAEQRDSIPEPAAGLRVTGAPCMKNSRGVGAWRPTSDLSGRGGQEGDSHLVWAHLGSAQRGGTLLMNLRDTF